MNTTLPRTKWILKGCPVCRGDLFYDVAGKVLESTCLQCSSVYDRLSIDDFLREGVASEASGVIIGEYAHSTDKR